MKWNWLKKKGTGLLEGNRGSVNLQGILMMGLGFVFIGVGFIVFQIFMNAASDLIVWESASCNTISDATFTGFTDIVGITPLLVLVGFMAAGVFAMYLGVKVSKGSGTTKMDLGTLILLALAIIFMAIALIILPVTLTSIAGMLAHSDNVTEADTADTGVGQTTSGYLLTRELLCAGPQNVISISTNVGTDVPVAYHYNPTTGSLNISGLTAANTRSVNTNYYYPDHYVQFTGVYDFLLMSPLLLIVSLIGGGIVTGFLGMKRLSSGGD